MKNIEVINLYKLLFESVTIGDNKPVLAAINEIRCSRLQWWKDRNIPLIRKEFSEIMEGINKLKPEELLNAEKEMNEKRTEKELREFNNKMKAIYEAFEMRPDIIEIFNEESRLEITKIKFDDLPGDLNGIQKSIIDWMVE